MLLWPSWCIVLTDVVMHVAALLLCWIRIQQQQCGGVSSSSSSSSSGTVNTTSNRQQPISSPPTTPPQDYGLMKTSSSPSSGGGGGGGFKHATIQIGDAGALPDLGERNSKNNVWMARPPPNPFSSPPQLLVVLPWVQAVGSMTSVMSNSWTFYYRLSEVVYTALLFVGDVWVGIQCASTTSSSRSSVSSSLPKWKCGAACTMAVLILFFAIEVVSLGAMPPTLPHSAEVYMRHHQCGFYHPSRILLLQEEGGEGENTTTAADSAPENPSSVVGGGDEGTLSGVPTSPSTAPTSSLVTSTPDAGGGEIDLVEAEIQKHAVPGESPSTTNARRQLAATDIPLEILGRIAGYISGSCNCIVAGCAIASLGALLRRIVVVGSSGGSGGSSGGGVLAPPSLSSTNTYSGSAAISTFGPYSMWAMITPGGGGGGGIDSSYFVPLPTLLETFLGAVCALAYVAMLQQEYDDTFYASHAEMMRWYICTIATLVHNITIGITVIVHRQRHRLVFLEVGGSKHQGVSNPRPAHHHLHHIRGASPPLLPTIMALIRMALVVPCACWYDLLATLKKLR